MAKLLAFVRTFWIFICAVVPKSREMCYNCFSIRNQGRNYRKSDKIFYNIKQKLYSLFCEI